MGFSSSASVAALLALAGCGATGHASDGGSDLSIAGDLGSLDAMVHLDFRAPPDLATTGPTFYISPDGADTNDGASPTAPWLTFAHAIPLLTPGATLILLDGTYDATATGYPNIDCAGPATSGTPTRPITLRADNERGAFLRGNGGPAFSMRACSYWHLDGLRGENSDGPSATSGDVFRFVRVDHIALHRLLAEKPNRHLDSQPISFDQSNHILIEECEIYRFHRYGIEAHDSFEVTVRRCYLNSRGYADLGDFGTDCPAGGDEGISFYHARNSIAENNIVENVCQGYGIHAQEDAAGDTGQPDQNRFLGDVALAAIPGAGFALDSRCTDEVPCATGDRIVQDTLYRDDVAIGCTVGFQLHGGVNTSVDGVTIIDAAMGGGLFDRGTNNIGLKSASVFVTDTLVTGSTGFGLEADMQADWSFDFCDGFGVTPVYVPNDVHVTDDNSGDPHLAGCRVYLPPKSPLRLAGKNGADIGANIVRRYVDGTLSADPLWDQASGAFPCGAVVTGVSDVVGDSCHDVHQRLHVGSAGCLLP